MNIARISGWLAGVAGAAVVAIWSYAIAIQVRAPATAAALNLPFTQTAKGALAIRSLAQRQAEAQREGNAPAVKVNRIETRLAESAYRSDPLAVTAIGILGMSISDAGTPNKGRAVLDAAGRLSRRSSLVSSQLIEAAGRAGDESTVFLWLSRAMLTDEKVRNAYIAAMAEATAQDRSVAALVPIVGPAPAWSDYYWSAVLARPRSLVNAAKIRIAIARGSWPKKDMTSADQQLVANLVAIREFEMAQGVASTLKRGQSGARSSSAILSGDVFSDAPVFAPFDWQLSSEGNLGASIDKANMQIVVSAIPGASGFAARQLVRLNSGNHVLSWTMSSEQAIAKNALAVSLQCAEEGAQEKAASVVLAPGKNREIVSVPPSSCGWYWVSIDVTVPDGAVGLDAQIGGLALSKGAAWEKNVDARSNTPVRPASASGGL